MGAGKNDNAVVELKAAFAPLKKAGERLLEGDSSAREESLKEIFRFNVAIGKLARSNLARARELREVQSNVNAITVAVKYSRLAELRDALERTEMAIESLHDGP